MLETDRSESPVFERGNSTKIQTSSTFEFYATGLFLNSEYSVFEAVDAAVERRRAAIVEG